MPGLGLRSGPEDFFPGAWAGQRAVQGEAPPRPYRHAAPPGYAYVRSASGRRAELKPGAVGTR